MLFIQQIVEAEVKSKMQSVHQSYSQNLTLLKLYTNFLYEKLEGRIMLLESHVQPIRTPIPIIPEESKMPHPNTEHIPVLNIPLFDNKNEGAQKSI